MSIATGLPADGTLQMAILRTCVRSLWWQTDELFTALADAGNACNSFPSVSALCVRLAANGWLERRPLIEYTASGELRRGRAFCQWRQSPEAERMIKARDALRRRQALNELRKWLPDDVSLCPQCGATLASRSAAEAVG